MAWLESHQSIRIHPKTRRAARALGVSIPLMVGHLHLLWHWALDYAQDGSLADYEPADIADAAMWEGDPDLFCEALLQCGPGKTAGFLERDETGALQIHDWWEYAGRLIAKRQADAERKRNARNGDVQRTSGGHPADIQTTAQVNQPTNINQPNSVAAKTRPAPRRVYGDGDPEFELASRLEEHLTRNNPGRKPTAVSTIQQWADEVRLMAERDERALSMIRDVLDWSQDDDFWKTNILSMGKLRKKFDQLVLQMRREAKASPNGKESSGFQEWVPDR